MTPLNFLLHVSRTSITERLPSIDPAAINWVEILGRDGRGPSLRSTNHISIAKAAPHAIDLTWWRCVSAPRVNPDRGHLRPQSESPMGHGLRTPPASHDHHLARSEGLSTVLFESQPPHSSIAILSMSQRSHPPDPVTAMSQAENPRMQVTLDGCTPSMQAATFVG